MEKTIIFDFQVDVHVVFFEIIVVITVSVSKNYDRDPLVRVGLIQLEQSTRKKLSLNSQRTIFHLKRKQSRSSFIFFKNFLDKKTSARKITRFQDLKKKCTLLILAAGPFFARRASYIASGNEHTFPPPSLSLGVLAVPTPCSLVGREHVLLLHAVLVYGRVLSMTLRSRRPLAVKLETLLPPPVERGSICSLLSKSRPCP